MFKFFAFLLSSPLFLESKPEHGAAAKDCPENKLGVFTERKKSHIYYKDGAQKKGKELPLAKLHTESAGSSF